MATHMLTVARAVSAVYLLTSLSPVLLPARPPPPTESLPPPTPHTDTSPLPAVVPPQAQLLALDPIANPLLPWTWLTYPAFEASPVLALVATPALYLSLRYFERGWSPRGLLKFLAGTTLAGAGGTIALAWLLKAVLGVVTPRTHGVAATLAALVVAFKQGVPEHVVSAARVVPGFRVKHLPFAWLLLNVVLFALMGAAFLPNYLLSTAGFVASWWYLRFVRFEDGIRGDRSDAFAFVAFFPDKLQPFLRPVLNGIFHVFVTLRLISPTPTRFLDMDTRRGSGARGVQTRRFLAAAPKAVVPGAASVGSASSSASHLVSESERRKAMALKALEDRLKLKAAAKADHVS